MQRYGLQLRKKPAASSSSRPPPPARPLAAFADDGDDDVEADILRQSSKKRALQKVEELQKKAIEEDPSVFAYDEVYDDMKEKAARPKMQAKVVRQSKYIEALKEKAEQRKREQDIVYERKLHKERSKEDHLFSDKDKFVTSAYRKKLEEEKKWLEEERRRQLQGLSQKFSRDHSDVEDDEVGPVFVKLPDMGWIKVNNFSACDQCRTSHVKCSLSVTGGPCNHCKNRNQICKVYGWAFSPECPAFHIYKPVLPPPAAAPPSPPPFVKREPYRFEWELLVKKLTWLQCEAPRKFRKRCTAMPWKDEQTLEATGDHSRKRSPVQQLECSLNSPHDHSSATSFQKTSHFSLESRKPSFAESLSKKRRISREAKASIFDCVPATEKPVMPSTQHRMSISFILSSIEI